MSATSTTGFTKLGQPILNRRYLLKQPGNPGLPEEGVEIRVTAKFFGQKGSADLIGVQFEEVATGGRETFPWPIEAEPGSADIVLEHLGK